MDKLYSRQEAAEHLRISVGTLDALRKSGKISYLQSCPGGKVLFTANAIQTYITRKTHTHSPKPNFTYRTPRSRKR